MSSKMILIFCIIFTLKSAFAVIYRVNRPWVNEAEIEDYDVAEHSKDYFINDTSIKDLGFDYFTDKTNVWIYGGFLVRGEKSRHRDETSLQLKKLDTDEHSHVYKRQMFSPTASNVSNMKASLAVTLTIQEYGDPYVTVTVRAEKHTHYGASVLAVSSIHALEINNDDYLCNCP